MKIENFPKKKELWEDKTSVLLFVVVVASLYQEFLINYLKNVNILKALFSYRQKEFSHLRLLLPETYFSAQIRNKRRKIFSQTLSQNIIVIILVFKKITTNMNWTRSSTCYDLREILFSDTFIIFYHAEGVFSLSLSRIAFKKL